MGGARWLYVVRIGLARPLTDSDLRLLVDWETGPRRCVWHPVPDDPYAGDVHVHGPARDAAPAVRIALGWLDSMLSRSVRPRLLAVWPAGMPPASAPHGEGAPRARPRLVSSAPSL